MIGGQQMDYEKTAAQLAGCGCEVRQSEPLSAHTGFRTGGAAALMALPKDVPALTAAVKYLRAAAAKYYILGNGSNVVAPDGGYDGVVVKTEKLNRIEVTGANTLHSECGALLTSLCRCALDAQLSGIEFAYGIPGSVGGAVYMNAGAYGGEIKDVIAGADVLCEDAQVRRFSCGELELAYRSSVFHKRPQLCVLAADFQLQPGTRAEIKAQMNELLARRREKQPLNLPSCGSTFKRPQGAYASALIEQCGLKGRGVGAAQVSEKHSGFVVNTGGASTKDVLDTIELVRETVRRQTGFELEPEVRFLQ